MATENLNVQIVMTTEMVISVKELTAVMVQWRLMFPQDRKSTFNPQIVKKRQKDISDIDQKSFLCMQRE